VRSLGAPFFTIITMGTISKRCLGLFFSLLLDGGSSETKIYYIAHNMNVSRGMGPVGKKTLLLG